MTDQPGFVTHRIVKALDEDYTVCCGRSPLVLPEDDHITSRVQATTCHPGKTIA